MVCVLVVCDFSICSVLNENQGEFYMGKKEMEWKLYIFVEKSQCVR